MSEGHRPGPGAGQVFGAGVVLFAGLAALLAALPEVALLDGLYLGALLALLPALAVAQLDALEDTHIERMPAYGGSVVALMILTGVTVAVGAREGGLESLGLVPLPATTMAVWTGLLLAGGLGTIFVFRQVAVGLGLGEAPLLRQLIPRTPTERGIFAVLSFWAGVGEELTYRGYAILTLAPVSGTVGAALVTSAVFGVLHAYQGALGIVRAGAMGGVLAWGFLATGSLWPAVFAHMLIDLVAGLVLADRLMVPAGAAGVDDADDFTGGAGTTRS